MKSTSYEWVHGVDLFTVEMKYRPEVATDLIVINEHAVENVYHLNTKDVHRGCLLDVGANIGSVSAWWLAAGGNAYAVEPNRENKDVLLQNLWLNDPAGGRWKWTSEAVGADYGYGLTVGNGGGATVKQVKTKQERDTDIVPLDQLIDDARSIWGDISVLKIDVEGAEVDAIMASERLGECLRVCVEFNDGDSARIGQMMDKLAHTHSLEILGASHTGGMIWGHRYNARW